MDVYFGVGGELLTPLDEMLDGDIKLSLELDLELKDPINNGIAACADDWGGWGSLRTSPSFDLFGEKENCIMVSPEAVMPVIKREIKHKPPPSPSPTKGENPFFEPHASLILECDDTDGLEGLREEDLIEEIEEEEEEEEEAEEEDEDEEEEDDEEEEEEEDEEEEEQVVKEIKILPKERSLWNSAILTKPAVVKTENSGLSYLARQKTEIIVAKSPSTHIQPQQTVRVLHATKKSTSIEPSPQARSLLIKRPKLVDEGYPKPAYSYSCLIAMALKNSITGSLPVSEIYNFMCEHFPYFKSAPAGWKNSVRHNLSLNKCFEKIEKGGAGGGSRKGCLWAMNPSKVAKMDDEVAKWSKKDPSAIRRAMKYPEDLERLERGDLKIGSRRDSYDSGAEDDESSDSSDSDSEEVPPSLKRFDSRLSSQESNDLGLPDEMYEELGILEEVMSSDPETEPGPQVKRLRLGIESYQRQPVRPV